MKQISIIIFCIFIFACNNGKNNETEIPQKANRVDDIIAIITKPDSTKEVLVLTRAIDVAPKWDSTKTEWGVKIDTNYGKKFYVPLLDSITNKPVLDSSGKQKANPVPRYILINKDSVKWKGIEGLPLDSLLKKTAPTH